MKILRHRVTAVFQAVDFAESFASDGQINLSVFSLTFSGQREVPQNARIFSYSSPLNDWEWLRLFPFMLFQSTLSTPKNEIFT